MIKDKANRLIQGIKRGTNYAFGPPNEFYGYSVFGKRAPKDLYENLGASGKVGFAGGRVAGDILSEGSRHHLWNIHPADVVSTVVKSTRWGRGNFPDRRHRMATAFATPLALSVGSGNFNPLNIAEGGRPLGMSAITAEEDDPRKSTAPLYDLAIERHFLGRGGKLLPWKQFNEERPDVSYSEYKKYRDYTWNKDPGLLNKMSLGMAKGTMDGINDSPEVSILGYRITPSGVAAALGAIVLSKKAGSKYLKSKMRGE
jgi:hypothetical protein